MSLQQFLELADCRVGLTLWLVVLAGQNGHTVTVTYPYAYMTYIVSPIAGLGGGIIVAAARLQLVQVWSRLQQNIGTSASEGSLCSCTRATFRTFTIE